MTTFTDALVAEITEAFAAHRVKAAGDESDSDADLIERVRALVPELAAAQPEIIEELVRAFLSGFTAKAPAVAVDTTVRTLAERFAQARAGDLIDDITETTRDRVAILTARALADGEGPNTLARWLRDADDIFGTQRAKTIARTETALALGRGQKAAAESMGQDQKRWQPGDCAICQTNADDGWIDIDDAFTSGDDTEPAHPNCTCTVIFRTGRLYADGDEGDDQEEKARRHAVFRCPSCRRKLGEDVNDGARLACPRCKEIVVVT